MPIIKFEYWDFEHGFYVEFKMRYTPNTLHRILQMPAARNIRVFN